MKYVWLALWICVCLPLVPLIIPAFILGICHYTIVRSYEAGMMVIGDIGRYFHEKIREAKERSNV